MNRFLTIFTILFICCNGIYGQKKKSALRNNLKSLVVYEQKYDKATGKPVKDSEAKFDTQGNVVEEIEYEDNKISKHVKYDFDDAGKKIKETELDATGKTSKITEYKYDDNGKKIKETEINSSGKPYKIIEYKYDGDLKTEKVVYDGNHKIKSKKTYQYATY
jgi:hypothetical protein